MNICQLPPKKHLRYSLRFTPALLWEHKCSVVASKATVSLCRPSSKRNSYIVLLFNPLNICKILPRRRGSGSDEVDDEGVETRGKAESRKKKVEIANLLAMNICQLPPKKHLLFLVPLRRGTAILFIQNPQKTHPCTPPNYIV